VYLFHRQFATGHTRNTVSPSLFPARAVTILGMGAWVRGRHRQKSDPLNSQVIMQIDSAETRTLLSQGRNDVKDTAESGT
jgi:hypothetical protein